MTELKTQNLKLSTPFRPRTPISYYGGKQAIISHILPIIPPHEVYTEVFFGGGTVFFAKKPAKNETINDKLDICVNFYQTLHRDFDALKKRIDETLISRTIFKQGLTIIRNKDKHTSIDLAWAFWLCTNFAFSNKIGGGYKYSNDMGRVVPETLRMKKREFTEWLKHRLEGVYIENEDAIKVLRSRNVKKAFHYEDPPYPNADQGHYAGYTDEYFDNLLSFNATECKGKFLLSSYHHPLLDYYVKEYGWYQKQITRRLQVPKTKRDKIEVLTANYNIHHIHTQDLFT